MDTIYILRRTEYYESIEEELGFAKDDWEIKELVRRCEKDSFNVVADIEIDYKTNEISYLCRTEWESDEDYDPKKMYILPVKSMRIIPQN